MNDKIIFWIGSLLLVLTACSTPGREPGLVESRESVGRAELTCTEPEDGRSLGLFPQEGRTIMINGFDLPVGSQPRLRITAVIDNGPIIERIPTVNEEGGFSETVELPEYDYMRWNIRLIDDEGVLCHYLVMGGSDWLEMGYDGPSVTEDALAEDMAFAAEQMGVPQDALEMQAANEDAISELNARLYANAAETFGGLWIQWEPTYCVVVAFTEDGEETVAQFLPSDSPLWTTLEIRTVRFTQAQLEQDQEALFEVMETADFEWASATDLPTNSVILSVPAESVWAEFVAAEQPALPDSLQLDFVYSEEAITFTPPSNLNPVPEVYMAKRPLPSIGFQEALLNDNLLIADGCVFADGENGRLLIVWQPGYFVHDADGVLQILNEAGELVAENGQPLYMGGGSGQLTDQVNLVAPVPDACQTESVWFMGQFLPTELRE